MALGIITWLGLVYGCGGDDDNATDTDTDNGDESSRSFNAGATVGDLITYTINDIEGTISYNNLTTKESGSNPFTPITEGELSGALQVTVGTQDYLVLPVEDRMVAAIVPLEDGDQLIVGVKRHDITPTAADYAGHYIYIHFNENPADRGWGTYDIFENGTLSSVMYDITGAEVWNGSGTWVVDSQDPSLLAITSGGVEVASMVLPDSVMVIDDGPGIGIDVGVEEPPTPLTLADIAGTYISIDTSGHGTWTLDAQGNTDWTWTNTAGDIESGIVTIRRTTEDDLLHFNNSFYVDDPVEENPDAYMIAIPGDAFMTFYNYGDGTVGYGFAVRPQ